MRNDGDDREPPPVVRRRAPPTPEEGGQLVEFAELGPGLSTASRQLFPPPGSASPDCVVVAFEDES